MSTYYVADEKSLEGLGCLGDGHGRVGPLNMIAVGGIMSLAAQVGSRDAYALYDGYRARRGAELRVAASVEIEELITREMVLDSAGDSHENRG